MQNRGVIATAAIDDNLRREYGQFLQRDLTLFLPCLFKVRFTEFPKQFNLNLYFLSHVVDPARMLVLTIFLQ